MRSRSMPFAQLLAFAWAAFWLWFFIVESWAWHTPLRAAAPWVCVGLVFVVSAIVAWRWPRPGALVLIVVGVASGLGYAMRHPPALARSAVVYTTLAFSVPPVVAAVLLRTGAKTRP